MVLRDLSDDEYGIAAVLAKKLLNKQGPSDFAITCLGLAQSRCITRGQFDAIKKALLDTSPQKGWNRPKTKIGQPKSRKPITLAKI